MEEKAPEKTRATNMSKNRKEEKFSETFSFSGRGLGWEGGRERERQTSWRVWTEIIWRR